jgi:hypothetical protein
MRRAGVPENTVVKIAGWKSAAMFRRYDIQDGRDIQRTAEIMEQQLAERRSISPVSSTIGPRAPAPVTQQKAGKGLN